jgi:FkbH-like protein
LICFCPISAAAKNDDLLGPLLDAVEEQTIAELQDIAGVHLMRTADILGLYPVDQMDDVGADELGHIPYTPEFFAALGTMIARKFHALKRPPRKVIALDCDNTLWSGICGEDGPAGIRIDEPRQILQQAMKKQLDAGMLLCLCSKNNPEDVEGVFRITDMPLRRDDFAACRLNWEPKSQNLRALAQELNLGLDSIIFIDDNPIECAEVESNCPGVLTIQLPDDLSSLSRFFSHLWILDHAKVTEEDRKRTALYLQNRQREQFQAQAGSFADFLANLNLQITIAAMRPDQLARVAQLTERTNQFNFTTRRRSESEIAKLQRDSSFEILTVSVNDRFGDYGLVGVVIYHLTRQALDVDTFLLSCRVLGKGVEHRVLSRMGEIARGMNRQWVDVHFAHSPKNKPAFDFLETIGASFRHGSNGSTLFRFPAEFAERITFSPRDARPLEAPEPAPSRERPAPARAFAAKFPSCGWIATNAWSAAGIARQIESRSTAQPGERQPYVAPRNELERQLARIWQQLLRIERIGINDDFFALGGTSLLAVRLFAEFEKITGKRLPLVTLFRSPTIEQLARVAEKKAAANANSALVAIQPHGDNAPLVLIHGAGGGILWGYANLAAALPEDQPVYAIDPRWTAGMQHTSVEAMAERYITELRSLQPKGPYRLGGYCFGGYVAYEMARQLQKDGEQTALLLLIDSAAPNGAYDQIKWWSPTFLPRFLKNTAYWVQDFMRLDPYEKSQLVKRKLAVLKRSLAQRVSPSGRSVIDVEEFIDISQFPEDELKLWQTHLRAGSDFVPKPYEGRVTLLRTRRQPFLCSFDPLYGWRPLAQGGVEVHLIPGSHEAIFVEPDVTALAAQVNACLQAVQPNETNRKIVTTP